LARKEDLALVLGGLEYLIRFVGFEDDRVFKVVLDLVKFTVDHKGIIEIESVILAALVVENLLEAALRRVLFLALSDVRHIVVLIENIEYRVPVRVQLGQLENLEKKRHGILSHNRGVEAEFDPRVGKKLSQEVVEHRAVVVVMHFDLAVLIRLVPLNGKALPTAVQDTSANINEDQDGIFVLYFLLQCLVKVYLFDESERFCHR
jgi:hypothetical protein